MRATLQRALDRVEQLEHLNSAKTDALATANSIITRQDGEKKALEEVVTYKDRTIAAKDEALKAETDANTKLHQENELKDKRITQLEKELKSAKKRNKFAFILGIITGAVGSHAIGF